MRLGLAGPSYVPYSSAADTQRTVNLFPEVVGSERGKAPVVLYGTPGLSTRVTIADATGIKAIYYDTATKRTFAVTRSTGNTVLLYELTATTLPGDTATSRGTLMTSGGTMTPTSISSNGLELLIVVPEGSKAFVFTLATNTLIDVTDERFLSAEAWEPPQETTFPVPDQPDGVDSVYRNSIIPPGTPTGGENSETFTPSGWSRTPRRPVQGTRVYRSNRDLNTSSGTAEGEPKWGAYLDGYFIVLGENGRCYLSALKNGQMWDAIDVFTPESSPDTATMILANRGQLWIFGPESIEVWVNTGNADLPFAPQRNLTQETGLLYRYSVVAIEKHIFFVSRGQNGAALVVDARNYRPETVSNHAVTLSLQKITVTAAEPVAWTHQHMGHDFYVLTFPNDRLTWSYDPIYGKEHGWHERMFLNGEREEAHRGRCCRFIGGEDGTAKAYLVGDRGNGKIYALNPYVYTDGGTAIRRIRRCQHLSNEMNLTTYNELELDVDNSVGAVTYSLRWSDNGGKTFKSARERTVNGINPRWHRLGQGRDRVFEMSSDSAVLHAWIDAYMLGKAGRH